MYLLVDTVSKPAAFALFDRERRVVRTDREEISGREFERFLECLTETCAKAGIRPEDLEGIASVTGPAGFTGIRVVTLTLGTLAFAKNVPLFGLDYGELQWLSGWKGGSVLAANRDECSYSPAPGIPFEIRKKSEIPPGRYRGTVEESDFAGGGISVESDIDYAEAVRNLDLSRPQKRLDPLYLKKPHIT